MTAPSYSLLGRMADTARKALRLVRGGQTRQGPILPESPFAEWEYDDASDAVEDALALQTIDPTGISTGIAPAPGDATFPAPRSGQDPIAVNRAFFEGDHWQNGSGWIGPHPQRGELGFNNAMNEIALAFVSKNAVREVVTRRASGVAGKPMAWTFVPVRELKKDEKPTAEEQTAIEEATRLMRNWLKARKAGKVVFDALCTAFFAERAPLRIFVPAGRVSRDAAGNTFVVASSVEQALALIWPDHPGPEHAVVATDEDTKLECGVRLYESVEANAEEDEESSECAELCYLDQFARTVLRHVEAEEKAASETDLERANYSLDLGGRLTMFELHVASMISPQVQQHQRALNLACSVLPRAVVTGGFLERALLNAQLPGRYETDKDGIRTGRFIAGEVKVGAGTTNFYTGVELGETPNEPGVMQVATPDIRWRPPTPVDGQIAAAASHYHAILEQTGQLHVIMSGDASASGYSREQARAEFLETLEQAAPEAEAAMRFLIETPLAMAEALAGVPGALTRLVRVDVSARLNTGPLSPTEREAIEKSVGTTLSAETAMSMVGVDDPSAERAKMAKDPMALAKLRSVQGEALVKLTTAGAGIVGAAKALGMTEEEAQALLEGSEFNDPVPPTPTPQPKPPTGGGPPAPKPKAEPPKDPRSTKPGSSSGSDPGGSA